MLTDPKVLITLMPGLLILVHCGRLHPPKDSDHDRLSFLRPYRRAWDWDGWTDNRGSS